VKGWGSQGHFFKTPGGLPTNKNTNAEIEQRGASPMRGHGEGKQGYGKGSSEGKDISRGIRPSKKKKKMVSKEEGENTNSERSIRGRRGGIG